MSDPPQGAEEPEAGSALSTAFAAWLHTHSMKTPGMGREPEAQGSMGRISCLVMSAWGRAALAAGWPLTHF